MSTERVPFSVIMLFFAYRLIFTLTLDELISSVMAFGSVFNVLSFSFSYKFNSASSDFFKPYSLRVSRELEAGRLSFSEPFIRRETNDYFGCWLYPSKFYSTV